MTNKPHPASTHPSTFLKTALALAVAGCFLPAARAGMSNIIAVDGTDCTLAEAIANANTNTDGGANGCASGGTEDIVTLPIGGTLTLSSALPDISSAITIEGRGATVERTGFTPFRIFTVTSTGNLTLNFAQVRGGRSSGSDGGGILNDGGTLTLNGSLVTGNETDKGGGGIATGGSGTTTLNRSTVSGNNATGTTSVGGGIVSYGAGTKLMLFESTVSGNSARLDGGGIWAFQNGTSQTNNLTLDNSTVSGNSSGDDGGGIFARAKTTIGNSTVSGNTAAGDGGGIYNFTTATLVNSLISGNSGSIGAEIYNKATLTANANNLFGNSSISGVAGFTPGSNDIVPTVALSAILDVLEVDNGGGTATHALVDGSPAIDAVTQGTPVCTGTDQRGVNRPKDGDDNTTAVCDIGAYEVGSNVVDLRMAQTASVSTATIGDTVSFTLAVDNESGLERAAEATVMDTLPAGFSLVSATPSQGRCVEDPVRSVTCNLGSLQGGEGSNASVTLVTEAVAGGTFENTASVLGRDQVDVDANSDNDADSASVTVAGPGTVQFSAATYTVGEAGPTASITLTRTGGSSGAASVGFATSNGTATAPSDYTTQSTSVNWADGDMANKTVVVPIIDDMIDDDNETVNLSLSGATGASLGTQITAVLTITDNDDPPRGRIEFNTSAYNTTEGAANPSAILNRTAGSFGAASVTLSTSDATATAGSDYTAVNQTVSWADGDMASKTVTVPVTDDSLVESQERFGLALSNVSGATLGTQNTSSVFINDNDVADTTPNGFTFMDAMGVAVNSVQTSNSVTITGINVATPISVSGGTYSIGCMESGFTSAMGTINANQTVCVRHTASASFNTAVNTTLTVGGVLDTFTSTTAMAPAGRTISINDMSTSEGNSGTKKLRFTISLSAAATSPVTVRYATANGSAKAGTDYTAKSGMMSFAAGESKKKVTILVKGDRTREPSENFFVNLSMPSSGTTIADNQGRGTITNDD